MVITGMCLWSASEHVLIIFVIICKGDITVLDDISSIFDIKIIQVCTNTFIPLPLSNMWCYSGSLVYFYIYFNPISSYIRTFVDIFFCNLLSSCMIWFDQYLINQSMCFWNISFHASTILQIRVYFRLMATTDIVTYSIFPMLLAKFSLWMLLKIITFHPGPLASPYHCCFRQHWKDEHCKFNASPFFTASVLVVSFLCNRVYQKYI